MKAITCSQCGALVKEISLKERFADCNYCGAKIRLEENKIIEFRQPEPKLKAFADKERELLFEDMLEQNNDADSYNDGNKVMNVLAIFLVIGIFVGLPILLFNAFNSEPEQKRKTPIPNPTSQSIPKSPLVIKMPTPHPSISYRAYVQYNSDIGADYVEIPSIEMAKLPTGDIKELKKTVFAQRRIRVRVTINENGEVTDAKAQNGHQILQESSVEAAKKSLFSNRRKPISLTLTYIYILE
ncbi:MAG: hypothetical protein ACR2F2_01905 [Pyrinomonadaceae bacterium]